MTQKELKELLPYWQKRLRLLDWNVNMKFLDLDNDYGSCDCNVEDKTAKIKILKFSDKLWKDDDDVTAERVLVHEILHIHFWELHEGDTSHALMPRIEQLCNFLADALVPKA